MTVAHHELDQDRISCSRRIILPFYVNSDILFINYATKALPLITRIGPTLGLIGSAWKSDVLRCHAIMISLLHLLVCIYCNWRLEVYCFHTCNLLVVIYRHSPVLSLLCHHQCMPRGQCSWRESFDDVAGRGRLTTSTAPSDPKAKLPLENASFYKRFNHNGRIHSPPRCAIAEIWAS
jgi:hypothetical protein